DVGSPEHGAVNGIEAGQRGSRIHHERADPDDLVPTKLEFVDDVGRDTILDLEGARLGPVGAEALSVMERVEARSLERRLRWHTEDDQVEQHLERLLVLAVAARAAQGERRLAVL